MSDCRKTAEAERKRQAEQAELKRKEEQAAAEAKAAEASRRADEQRKQQQQAQLAASANAAAPATAAAEPTTASVLASLGLSQYSANFDKEEITLDVLFTLEENQLKELIDKVRFRAICASVDSAFICRWVRERSS